MKLQPNLHLGTGGRSSCRQVNLRYTDPPAFHREDYDTDPDTLIVEHAGRDLYLVEPLEA